MSAQGIAVQRSDSPANGHTPDAESVGWVLALSAAKGEREDAVERLHALLLRAAHVEVGRRAAAVADTGSDDLDDRYAGGRRRARRDPAQASHLPR
jgi:hypothetical protein